MLGFLISLPTPTYERYEFLGWATSIEASEGMTGYYTPEGDVTLYALWDKPNCEPDFVLPFATTVIKEEALFGCEFQYVLLSENTREIHELAFSQCSNLKMIYIPATTFYIDEDAFKDDNDLIIIGESGSYAETYAQQYGFDFSPR